jgi:hypothetical protein
MWFLGPVNPEELMTEAKNSKVEITLDAPGLTADQREKISDALHAAFLQVLPTVHLATVETPLRTAVSMGHRTDGMVSNVGTI